jgi:tRNA threonylcarbamoyladenosine biosynthesis protein TsaB
MIVLGVDCSTSACSVAILHDGVCLAHAWQAADRGHAGLLIPMVNTALGKAGRSYRQIDLYAVTTGPGSYTGIRIGLSAVRAMAMAAKKPVIGVTSMNGVARRIAREYADTLAQAAFLTIALETKRTDLYLQHFDLVHDRSNDPDATSGVPCGAQCGAPYDLEALSAPVATEPSEGLSMLPRGRGVLAGNAAQRFFAEIGDRKTDVTVIAGDHGMPDAVDIAAEAYDESIKRQALDGVEWPLAVPPPAALYLRPPDVTLPKQRNRPDSALSESHPKNRST